jgi:hypothetical protein
MTAPERIFAEPRIIDGWLDCVAGVSHTQNATEYTRAGLHDATKAQLEKAVEALRFYADEDAYETQYERLPCDCCTDIFEPINDDKGKTARAALAEIEKGEPK